MKAVRLLVLVLLVLASMVMPSTAAPDSQAGGDSPQPEDIVNKVSLPLVQNRAYLSDNNHTHLGQTWTGINNPLTINGSFASYPSASLVLSNSAGEGLRVAAAASTGISVRTAGGDGITIVRAGTPTSQASSGANDGVEVQGAEGNGFVVGRADRSGFAVGSAGEHGLRMDSAGQDGVYVGSAGASGVFIQSAGHTGMRVISSGNDGVYVNTAGWTGLRVDTAVYDGVRVYTAGSPSTATSAVSSNGFEVGGAQGYGLFVGRADLDGMVVNSAGFSGVNVQSAGWHGLYVGTAGLGGVYVNSAGTTGVIVGSAHDDGMYVSLAGLTGVYANTTQSSGQWGFYTPDAIHGSNVLMHSLSLVAQVSGPGDVAAGDVVAVAGIADPVLGSTIHVPLVRLADGSATGIAGVVQSRLALAEKPDPLQPAEDGARTQPPPSELRSVEGPAQAGDYVAITVFGAAQVKVDGATPIEAGQRLTAANLPGHARALRTLKVQLADDAGTTDILETAPVLGTALEPAKDGLVWVLVNSQ